MLRKLSGLPVLAVIPLVFSNSVQAELTILPDVTYENSLGMDNYDLILNQGKFQSSSYLNNWLDSVLLNYGEMENAYYMNFYDNSSLLNYGTIDNTYSADMSFWGNSSLQNFNIFNHNAGNLNFYQGSQFINTGTFNNYADIYSDLTASFNNDGILNNYFQIFANIRNSGTVVNEGAITSGKLINESSGIFDNSGTIHVNGQLTNNGEFSNDYNGYIIFNEGYDPVTYEPIAAEINNNAVMNNYGTIDANLWGGFTINNSGQFNHYSTIVAYENFVINNSGDFTNYGGLAIYGNGSELNNSGNFYNHSVLYADVINNSGYLENDNNISVWQKFVNTVSGVVDHMVSFMEVNGILDNQGTFNNNSDISFYMTNDPVTGYPVTPELNNSGVFNHNEFGAIYAMDGITINNSGDFNNNGYINTYENFVINNTGSYINNSLLLMEGAGSQLNNTGNFYNNDGLGVLEISNSGMFENLMHLTTGKLTNIGSGNFTNTFMGQMFVNGVLDNHGQFNNEGFIHFNEYRDPFTSAMLSPELNNSGVFRAGYIDAGSKLVINNSGEFHHEGGTIVADTIILNNTGTFNNYFSFAFDGIGSELNNSGVFNNNSFIDGISSYLDVRNLMNSGEFHNNGHLGVLGMLNNTGSGVLNNIAGSYMFLGERLDNLGEINNQGAISFFGYSHITSSAEFNNVGVFNNAESGHISIDNNYGLIINNSGIFNNSGYFDNDNLTINNYGVFNQGSYTDPYYYDKAIYIGQNSKLNNYGELNNYNVITGSRGHFTSELMNIGTINNHYRLSDFSLVRNVGVINNNYSFEAGSDQQIVNEANGVINNNDYANIYVTHYATLDNQGVINNKYGANISLDYESSAFDNSGTVNNESNARINLNNLSSSLNNSGVVNNDGEIAGTGIINNTGSINNHHEITGLHNITSSGSIVNNGFVSTFEMVITGGELSGNGDIYVGNGLVITEAGTLAPGNSTGQMNIVGDVYLDGTLSMEFDWLGLGGDFYDSVHVSQNVFISDTSVLDISFFGGDYFYLGDTFDLMIADSITGDFGSFYYDAIFDNSLALEWNILSDMYGQDILRLTVVSAVPLPAAAWLFMSGLTGLIVAGRRNKRHMTH